MLEPSTSLCFNLTSDVIGPSFVGLGSGRAFHPRARVGLGPARFHLSGSFFSNFKCTEVIVLHICILVVSFSTKKHVFDLSSISQVFYLKINCQNRKIVFKSHIFWLKSHIFLSKIRPAGLDSNIGLSRAQESGFGSSGFRARARPDNITKPNCNWNGLQKMILEIFTLKNGLGVIRRRHFFTVAGNSLKLYNRFFFEPVDKKLG